MPSKAPVYPADAAWRWTGGAGRWSDPTHWNRLTVPPAYADVELDMSRVGGIYTGNADQDGITIDLDVTVRSFFLLSFIVYPVLLPCFNAVIPACTLLVENGLHSSFSIM
jgi:hypothetical protein